jgi:hypothetical protein
MVRQPVPLSQWPGDRVDWWMTKAGLAGVRSVKNDIRLEEA